MRPSARAKMREISKWNRVEISAPVHILSDIFILDFVRAHNVYDVMHLECLRYTYSPQWPGWPRNPMWRLTSQLATRTIEHITPGSTSEDISAFEADQDAHILYVLDSAHDHHIYDLWSIQRTTATSTSDKPNTTRLYLGPWRVLLLLVLLTHSQRVTHYTLLSTHYSLHTHSDGVWLWQSMTRHSKWNQFWHKACHWKEGSETGRLLFSFLPKAV